jgi:hypothetical protein
LFFHSISLLELSDGKEEELLLDEDIDLGIFLNEKASSLQKLKKDNLCMRLNIGNYIFKVFGNFRSSYAKEKNSVEFREVNESFFESENNYKFIFLANLSTYPKFKKRFLYYYTALDNSQNSTFNSTILDKSQINAEKEIYHDLSFLKKEIGLLLSGDSNFCLTTIKLSVFFFFFLFQLILKIY